MRKSTLAGAIVLFFGSIAVARPILGPTLVSEALERDGVSVVTPADDCNATSSPLFSTYGRSLAKSREGVKLRDELCIPGPECGQADSEVLVFPEGNGLFYQCRARSALGVLTPGERSSLVWALLFELVGLLLCFAIPIRHAISRRRWATVD